MPLTHPVDPASRFDFWDTDTNAFATRITTTGAVVPVVNMPWPRPDGMATDTPPHIVPLLRITEDPVPGPNQRRGPVGEPVVDLEAQTITYPRPLIEITVEEARESAVEALKYSRIEALASGFTFNGKRFQTRNSEDILNITNMGIASANPAFATEFIAEDNTAMPMDAATAQAFYVAMLTAGQTIWAIYRAKRAALEAALDHAEIAAVDLTIPAQ